MTDCNVSLLQKFVEDLHSTVSPAYERLVRCLFELLPRRVSPETLSALLAALLSIFKHVLVPLVSKSDESDALPTTWTIVTSALAKCNLEIQRAVAEAWSSVLRRLKKNDRHCCVTLMVASAGTMNEFVTWSFVFAIKASFLRNVNSRFSIANGINRVSHKQYIHAARRYYLHVWSTISLLRLRTRRKVQKF